MVPLVYKVAIGTSILAIAATGVFAAMDVQAQGFATNDMGTCYGWTGGDRSAGVFIKCNPELQPLAKKPAPPVVIDHTPIVLQSGMSCPPSVPEKHTYVKRKPRLHC